MKRLKGLHLLVVLGIVIVSAGVFPPFADAQTIYALLLIDDGNPSNFQQHEMNQKRMQNLLKKIERTLGLNVDGTVLKSSASPASPDYPTSENIKKWIDTVNIDRNDIVFVYASAPGGANRQTRELYLSFSGVKVERPPIAKALAALPCRLKLLVTDAVSYGVEISEHWYPTSRPAYSDLFLEHRGFLNLASATEGEYAGGDDKGGWFTTVFVLEVLEKARDYDTNGDDFISWEEIFVATKELTEKIFEVRKHDLPARWEHLLEEIGQESQRPKYFGELPQRVD